LTCGCQFIIPHQKSSWPKSEKRLKKQPPIEQRTRSSVIVWGIVVFHFNFQYKRKLKYRRKLWTPLLLHELQENSINIAIYKSRATWPSTSARKPFIVVNYVYYRYYVYVYTRFVVGTDSLMTRSVWQCTRFAYVFPPPLCFLYFAVTVRTNIKDPLLT
jgi:hypothetical protein